MTSPPAPIDRYVVAGRALTEVSIRDVNDEMLARFHALMESAFPPSELMTYEELREARKDPGTSGTLLVDGEEPIAGCVTETYLGGRILLLAYLVVATAARSTGLGSQLLTKLGRHDTGPGRPLVLAEIEDPRFHPADDRGDPVARVRFYERAGARLLPLPYAQPSLRAGSPRAENLLLITLGATGPDVDGPLIAAFLEEYYEACEGDAIHGDPAFATLQRLAGGDHRGRLPLHPLVALDEARNSPRTTGERGQSS